MPFLSHAQRSYLFMIRLWPEDLGDRRIEWRGCVELVPGGERGYFREWEALVEFLVAALPRPGGSEPEEE